MNIVQDLIPRSNGNRPGNPMTPIYITIHETANTSVGANAAMHARYVKNPTTAASWHFTVDDGSTVYQHLPLNENGWHAGDGGSGTGNRRSIGIEICVNRDGNFTRARANGASLARKLMKDFNIPIGNVVPHRHWSGKNCPTNLLRVWNSFISEVRNTSTPSTPPTAPTPSNPGAPNSSSNATGTVKVITNSLWVYNKADWNARHKTVNKNEIFTVVKEHIVNGSKMYELKSGLFITANAQYVTFTPSAKPAAPAKPSTPSNSFSGKRLVAKVDLNFYDSKRWERPTGQVKKGQGFPTIVAKHKVGNGEQYEVKNSRGATFFITASTQYVSVVNSGSASSSTSAPAPAKSKITVPNTTLRRGDRGNAVRQLQTALNALNFKVGAVDGDFGAKTEDAVRRFQSMYAPPVDGIVGPKTRSAMNSRL